MNCVEKDFRKKLQDKFKNRILTSGRIAHITANDNNFNGRGKCQSRNLCIRGCPFGGYYSSNSGSLPDAMNSGNMTLRPYSIVHSIIYDENKRKAIGVLIKDSETLEEIEYFSKIIFLCASTINSTSIMLNSKSKRFPSGFGNDSGELGHNIMDHQLL